ncbi:amino acid ABC transporter substrate-binding protein [Scopulibacillus cellulosilyticus]|uniref:Amino acid ABC transporter substrate-binding protein n=1 Tax=Scopulibacillus cellulosilyticus TaxID=2665665 RepID=A0ABW2Q1G7_9BACL
MKKVMTVLVSILLISMLAACGTANKQSDQSKKGTNNTSGSLYNQVKSKGVLTIGTEGTYPPFTYHDKNGNLTGFDVDIAKEVAKRLGVKPKFVETKWDGMIAGLDDKRFDMVANEVAITNQRKQKYDFSSPYIASRAVLIVRKDNHTIKSFNDIKGKTFAQSLTSNLYKIAKQHGAKITSVDGFNDAVDLLTSNRVDGTINDNLSYLDLKKRRPDVPIKVVDKINNATQNGLMFRKNSGELVKKVNKALADMKKDGTYLKISKKYFGTDVSK